MLTDKELQSLRNLGNEAEAAADEIERLRALTFDYAVMCGELSKGLREDDPVWHELRELGDRLTPNVKLSWPQRPAKE